MKTFPNLHSCLAITWLLSGLLAFAADPPKPSKPEAKPRTVGDAQKNSDPWQRRLSEVQADNLPLSEVANLLSEQFPEINFVLHPAVKDIPVALKLRAVTLEDIFTAIDIGTQNSGQAIDPNTGLAGQVAVQANKLNDRMVSFTFHQTPLPEATKPVCRAFSLGRYLAGKSEEEASKALGEVEQALETCWAMLQEADRTNAKLSAPRLSLHRATKLLIVVGQPSQVEVVEQVINQLEDGGRGGFGAGRSSGGPMDPSTGVPLPAGYGVPGIPSTPKPPGGK